MSGNSPVDWPDDETLLAFADGRLDAESAARVVEHLETHVHARRTVAMYQHTGELAKRAFDEAMHVPASPALIGMLSEEADAAVLLRPTKAKFALGWRVVGLAASVVLIIGGLFAFSMFRFTQPQPVAIALGGVERDSALERLLETKATGVSEALPVAALGAQKDVTLILTFRDRQQRPCREFESAPRGTSNLDVAVACRNVDGGWTIEGAARVTATTEKAPPDFRPAGGNGVLALESVLKVLGASAAISPDDEAALISSGWKK